MIVSDGEKPVLGLSFTPDGKQLLASRTQELVEVRSVPDGALLSSLPRMVDVDGRLFVHPAGRVAYTLDPKLAAVPLKGQPRIHCPGLDLASLLFSRDGRFAIVRPRSDKAWLLGFRCDARGKLAAKPTWAVKPYAYDERLGGFVGDGSQFVTVDNSTLVIRDTATGEVRSTAAYPSAYAFSRLTSPDGRWFASEGYGKLYLYSTATWGKPVRLNSGCANGAVQPLAFHPTRPILMALLGAATIVKYLNPETGEVLKKFRWNLGDLWCVAFSPDGTLAAASGIEGKIVVWDVDE